MKTFTPRISTPVAAVRITEDVLAEKGDWIFITEDEKVVVCTDAQFQMMFAAGQTTASGPSPKKRFRQSPKNKGKGPLYNGAGRVLYVIRNATTPITDKRIKQVLPNDVSSISGRLTGLKEEGYIISHKSNDVTFYSVTAEGIAVIDPIGREMFGE